MKNYLRDRRKDQNKGLTSKIEDCKLISMLSSTTGEETKIARKPGTTTKSNYWLLALLVVALIIFCFCSCFIITSGILIAYKLEQRKAINTPIPTLVVTPGSMPSAVTLAEINNNRKKLDDDQWKTYSKSLQGIRIHWRGRILDVTRDGTVYVEVDESIFSYVYLDGIQKEVLVSLKKGQMIEFDATIKKVSAVFFLQVWLENPDLMKAEKDLTPSVSSPPTDTPQATGLPQPSITPSSTLAETSPTITPTASPSPTPTETPAPPTETQTLSPSAASDGRPACLSQKTSIQRGLVTNVVNGETVDVIIDGVSYKVRYIGINAPKNQPGEPRVYYTDEAKEKNRQLVEGRNVTLVRDVSDTDQQGFLLRYVFVGDLSGTFVNYEMVRQGYATAITYLPDVACTDTFRNAELVARAGRLGLWSSTFTPTPVPSSQWDVNITRVFFQGSGEHEWDEYVEFRNDGAQSIQLKGWTLRDEAGHTIGLPEFIMEPDQICRVYTNQVHPDTCGFSFGFRTTTVWNNAGDCAYLNDDRGYLVDRYCYTAIDE